MNPGGPAVSVSRRRPARRRDRAVARVAAGNGTELPQRRAPAAGIVGREGGGTAPHPMGGGAAWGIAHDTRNDRPAVSDPTPVEAGA